MDNVRFDAAQQAYDAGDYSEALEGFFACVDIHAEACEPGETGRVYHLAGNSLVKLHRYDEAIEAYRKSLIDEEYSRLGAVNANLGMALGARKSYEEAVGCFEAALADEDYETPYKAYSGMGGVLLRLGRTAEAGVAYRRAALDKENPDPSKALVNLGVCFMALDRPHDAVEAYQAALNFEVSKVSRNKIHANLGQAYAATDRMREAADAFAVALEDGTYELSSSAQEDYEKACVALGGVEQASPFDELERFEPERFDPDRFEPTAMNDPFVSPSNTGSIIPSADDTGFFSLTEAEMTAQGKLELRSERRLRNIGLKVLLVVVLLVTLCAAGAVGAYILGYGWPTQETVITEMFDAHASGGDSTVYWSGADESDILSAMNAVAETDDITIDAIDRSMTTSTATVTATLDEGAEVRYIISMTRDGLTWKITAVELQFASNTAASDATAA